MPDRSDRRRAVVIGGSLAGLLAARVLADHFDEVVVVERDTYPDTPEPRKGVPQARHLHILLVRGQRLLEAQFPGLMAELLEAGAVTLNWPRDILWLGGAGWGSRTARGMTLVSSRRELLEDRVRRRVIAQPNVLALEGTDVVGLIGADAGKQVRGVRVQARAAGDGATRELEADLVVDASGSLSAAGRWLTELGHRAPEESVVNSFLGYASRFYERPPDDGSRDWTGLLFQPNVPAESRGGGVFPVDGGLWHVTLGGAARDFPPVDEPGYLAFAASLRSPALHDALRAARPVSPIWAYRRTQNRWRHFEALPSQPEGFIVLGDAACRFNPVYGQGMTVAAESALVLGRWLAAGEPAHGFQRRLAAMLEAPWLLATNEDLRYPTTEGGRSNGATRLVQRYLDRLILRGRTDDVVADTFLQVVHLLQPARTLFNPEMVTRVMAGPRSAHADGLGPPPSRPRRILSPVEAMPIPVRERVVEGDGGVRLHAVEAGEGPLVVLVHGFPDFWYSWRRQLPALADAGYRAVALDLRGYNLSDKPHGIDAYGARTIGRDVAAVIQNLGVGRATVVAHDWGGAAAWAIGADRPDLVDRLVVMNSPHPARFRQALRDPEQLRRSAYIASFQVPRIPELLLGWGEQRFLRSTFRMNARPEAFTDDDIERYRDALARPGALTSALNYYRAMRRPTDRRDALIDVPVLVIWGDRDPWLGSDLAEPPAALVPDVRVEHLPDAGHWVHLDEPDRVNALLLGFLPGAANATPREVVAVGS